MPVINGIEVDDSYKIDLDEEDDDDNYSGDDVYDDTQSDSQGNHTKPSNDPITLSDVVGVIENFASHSKLSDMDLKHNLIDLSFEERLSYPNIDLLLDFSTQDSTYKAFLIKLIPEVVRVSDRNISDARVAELTDTLAKSTSIMIWSAIESKIIDKTPEQLDYFLKKIDGKVNFYCKNDDKGITQIIESLTRNWSEIGYNLAEVLNGSLSTYLQLDTLFNGENSEVEADTTEVKVIVNDILNIYDRLYAPCFVNRPLGILTSEGVLTLGSDSKPFIISEGRNYAKKLYEAVQLASGKYLPETTPTGVIDSSYLSREGKLLKTISPEYHLYNICGISSGKRETNWISFRQGLSKYLFDVVRSVLSKVEGDTIHIQNEIKSLFTNCIIFDEFDRVKSLRMRVKLSNFTQNIGTVIDSNAMKIFAIDTGKVLNSSTDSVGIQNILYLFDEKAYNAEILFAYKAYERLMNSGIKPSTKNVVLGRDLKGNDVTENLDDAGNVITGIIAGSRSGKGVLTLNILASLYADECPVMYLDYKPDMAATLWEMEKEFKAKGIQSKIFAIDSLANRRSDGVTPARPFPYGLNQDPEANLAQDDYALFPYLKTMQFASLLAQLRASGVLPNHKKMFFILDEAQKLNSRYGILLDKINKGIKANAVKKNNEPSSMLRYFEKLQFAFNDDLKDGMKNIINTVGGTGRVSLIILGQKADPDEWKLDGEGSWKSTLFGNIIGNTNIKLIGRDSGNSPTYGISKLNSTLQGGRLLDERGYFAKYRGAKTPEKGDSAELLKSYLVLNKNDFDFNAYANNNLSPASFTGALLTNLKDSTVSSSVVNSDLLNEDGSIRESIGFVGLMKLITGGSEADLGAKMSIGYRAMEDIFIRMGLDQRYSCVEEYLYDCSPDSIFSLSELKEMLNGKRVGTDNKKDENVDWFADSKRGSSTGFNELGYYSRINELNKVTKDSASKAGFGKNIAEDTIKNRYHQNGNPKEAYTGKIEMPYNPFTAYGTSSNPIPILNVIRNTSRALLSEMKRYFGDLNRIESLNIKSSGLLIINNRPFRPEFSPEVIDTMPEDIRDAVSKGYVVDIFHFDNLRKFKNLQLLEVENFMLAEGRMRRELGINRKKPWSYLFKEFQELNRLVIGEEVITDEVTAQAYDKRGRGGYTDEAFAKLRSPMAKMLNTRPAKVAMNALGYSLGIKALGTIALIGGPFGMVFSAMVGVLAYNEYKKTHLSKLPQKNNPVQKQYCNGQNKGNSYGQNPYPQRPRQQNNSRNRNNRNEW